MPSTQEIEQPGSKFSQVLEVAARLPGVRINRTTYLRAALKRHCTEEQIERAIAGSPAAAGIPLQIITDVANTSIAYETSKATGISAVAGIPGGFAMIGTVPGDMVQYLGHMLRIAQKLAYIYSWPDLFVDGGDEIDEATEGILTLFVGVMVGVQFAQGGVSKVSAMIAAQVVKKLPQQALTRGAIYPIVKKVAAFLGVSMTKKLFASGVAKAIPVVGAVLSGGLTLGTFLPMSKKLQKHLASLELTKPGHRTNGPDIIDGEFIDMDVVEEFPGEDGEQSGLPAPPTRSKRTRTRVSETEPHLCNVRRRTHLGRVRVSAGRLTLAIPRRLPPESLPRSLRSQVERKLPFAWGAPEL